MEYLPSLPAVPWHTSMKQEVEFSSEINAYLFE